MVTASFTGLLKTIFWIIIIYYAIKFLIRLLAPVLVQQMVKKAGQSFYEQQQQFNQQQQAYSNSQAQQRPNPEKPQEKKKVGEYIDFEEIE